MELSTETLETICHALQERSVQLSHISRTGLTLSIRKVAEEDLVKTYKAWNEVENLKNDTKANS